MNMSENSERNTKSMITNRTDLIEPGCRYAAEYLRALAKHLRGCRTGRDPEHIHQARVACRRIRAGLRVAERSLPAHKLKRWDKQLRSLAKRLGRARDLDVQIEYLRSVRSSIPDESPCVRWGLNRLILRWKQSRKALQPDIDSTITAFLASGTLIQMRKVIQSNPSLNNLSSGDEGDVSRKGRNDILERWRDLCQYQSSLDHPEQTQAHHQMRIAAKKFRYTMEIYNPLFDQNLQDYIRQIKTIQELLGQIHDCDVWLETLGQFVTEEQQRIREYSGHLRSFPRLVPGFEYFQAVCQQRRKELFEQMQSFWAQLTRDRFWEQLTDTFGEPRMDSVSPSSPSTVEVHHEGRQRKAK
jgi:CHAD domain-containing protein